MDADSPKPFAKKLQEKLAASRFFTFSLLLHTILVVMGGSVVLFQHYAEPPDFAASEGGLVTTDVDVAPPDPPADPTQQTFTPEAPSIPTPQLAAIATTNTSTPTFQVAAAVPIVKTMPTDAMNKALESKPFAKSGPSGVPGAMAGRIGGQNRQKMMDQMGGKKKAEEAVMRGLRWLVKNQSDDGSWAPTNKGGMTGFALLSFFGHGELPNSQEFGPTVQKGLDWLVATGTKFQGRLCMTPGIAGGGPVYEHAIATYALGEYYTLTKDEKVAELLKQAVGYIVKGQAADGGWSYGYADLPQSDTSVSGWQIQALKAAHLTGLNIEGVDAALDKAMLNLKRVQRADGGFGYKTPQDGNGYSLSGVGALCTYFWKQDKNELVRDAIKNILEKSEDKSEKGHPVEYKGKKADLYAWYYHTQACLMVGGAAWTKWNKMFQDQICDNQNADGSWPPIKGENPGGEHQKAPGGIGPFYRTNLCILMLEVFYRYSPTMK